MNIVEMYKFVRDADEWNKTSANIEVSYNGDTYVPAPIGRGDLEARNELSKSTLEVELDIFDDLAQDLLTSFTEKVLSLTLFIKTDAVTGVAWKGRLTDVKPTKTKLKLSFENIFTSMRRPGLRARYQKPCRHLLYGRGCGLDPEAFATAGRVLAISGTFVTVAEAALQPDGYYLGGMLRGNDGILGYIISHSGSIIGLQRPIDSLTADFAISGYGLNYGNLYGGLEAKLYPGCDRLRQTCETKFNNLDNYGGFPWIPSRNPMDGSSIV